MLRVVPCTTNFANSREMCKNDIWFWQLPEIQSS